MMFLRTILGAAAVLASAPALAETPAVAGSLDLSRRIVASSGTVGEASAGYVRVVNASSARDQLVGVTCTCASRVEFHHIRRSATGVSMDSEPVWDVPAQGALDIRPGSDLHLMLIDFDPAKAVEGQVVLTLAFRDAGVVEAGFALTGDSRAAWAAYD
ncbi:hypothetical protein KOAAANKH_03646 [Brevundimonas sp. NIBR10]|uniref:copper chaperone PCu(A)C n=1 Tax=Brevundimonas sp. NIBR10 TaxID=3015997 RepID=UPI0022F15710|nr:copper chaperone PCu(A)C [Brevundimonas sp. NIBR10]WGM48739.1 hypothetical protein KOAAANKH_03646 [Brevundimonas sp. NIBR10]